MKCSKQPSIMINFLMNTALTVSNLLFPLITFPYISRILLANGYGKVQLATAFVSYFVMFAQLGIPTYGIKACAAVREDQTELSRVVHELTIIQTITMIVSYVTFFICLQTMPKLQEEKALYLIASTLIFFSSIGMEWLFKALEQYSYITIRSLVFRVISLVSMFLMVRTQGDYLWYTAISVVSAAGSNVLNLTQVPKYIIIKPIGNYCINRHFKPVLILFAYLCATTIYTNLDSVMLGFMATDADVGYYGVAVKIKGLLVSLVTSLGTVILPRVSYYYENEMYDEFWKITEKSLKVIILMALPTTIFFMLFASNSIYFLAGQAYAPSILPMIVIMPTVLFVGLTSVTALQVLIPTKRDNIVLYTSIAAALVDVVINAFLIPHIQSTGAAIGTLIAEFVVLVVQVFILRKNILPMIKNLRIGLFLVAVAVAGIASWGVKYLPFGHFGVLLLGSIVFFGVYMLVLLVGKEAIILEIFKKTTNKVKRIIKNDKKYY